LAVKHKARTDRMLKLFMMRMMRMNKDEDVLQKEIFRNGSFSEIMER
jgi:hypothetical protein